MTLPSFLVIGAAKAGTTSLHHYLAEHPQVFVSAFKDPSFFAWGVDAHGRQLWGEPGVHHLPVRTLAAYEALFDDAGDRPAIGEASTMYLECPQAAERIRATLPDVRLLCSLRQPVDRAWSDYLMAVQLGWERFDPDRDLSPDAPWARVDGRWMAIGRYREALGRFYDRFPREHLRVLLFDDLRRDPVAWAQDAYAFLGVDPSFVPDVETVHTPGGLPSSRLVERVFQAGAALKGVLPTRLANGLRRLRARNLAPPPRLPAALRAELTERVRDDVLATGDLIGRDLSGWLGG